MSYFRQVSPPQDTQAEILERAIQKRASELAISDREAQYPELTPENAQAAIDYQTERIKFHAEKVRTQPNWRKPRADVERLADQRCDRACASRMQSRGTSVRAGYLRLFASHSERTEMSASQQHLSTLNVLERNKRYSAGDAEHRPDVHAVLMKQADALLYAIRAIEERDRIEGALRALYRAIYAVRADLGTQFPALSEAWVRAGAVLAEIGFLR